MDESAVYATDVPLPENFRQRFTNQKYNRLVFGLENDGKHVIIWLDGPGGQEKLMRFRVISHAATKKTGF